MFAPIGATSSRATSYRRAGAASNPTEPGASQANEAENLVQLIVNQVTHLVRRERTNLIPSVYAPSSERLVRHEDVVRNTVLRVGERQRAVIVVADSEATGDQISGDHVQRRVERRGDGPSQGVWIVGARRQKMLSEVAVGPRFGPVDRFVGHRLALVQHRVGWQNVR
jgi:hypothetical protein